MATIRCPHCGSPVMVRGNRWECGYCGDFGEISSLQPTEKAELVHAAAPSVRLTITVTDASDEEEPPRSFSRAELENMVRRWNFSEDEWACRDLLIAAFPEAVSRWTAEELENMDTQDLLSETGEKAPEGQAAGKGSCLSVFGRGHGRPPAGSVCPGTAVTAAENRRPSGQADLPVCLLGYWTENVV